MTQKRHLLESGALVSLYLRYAVLVVAKRSVHQYEEIWLSPVGFSVL